MTWIRVDDHFADHPKVMALAGERLRGLGLWHVAASYCARYLTDGMVPANYLRAHAPASLIERMVRVGLFERCDGGYLLHDWLAYNPPREKVLAERQAARDRMSGKRSQVVREKFGRTVDEQGEKFGDPVPVPVPEVLSKVLVNGVEPWEEPATLYQTRAHRRSLSQKERDWLEDLHIRFSRRELVNALHVVNPGPDYLKRVDAYLEGAA